MGRSRADSRKQIAVLMQRLQDLPDDDVDGQGWRLDASCRGLDPELFHPAGPAEAVAPLRVCRDCVVAVPCFGQRTRWGIWGGTTEWERSDFVRRGGARAG